MAWGTARAAEPRDAGRAEFDTGVAAYRQGDYAGALKSFLEARRLGMTSPALELDLGLTYYKLERNAEARDSFTRLAQAPAYRAVAEHHLGLVAERMGDRQQALVHLRNAERLAPDARVRNRARTALRRLGAATQREPFRFRVLAGGGYDSNPTLESESLAPSQQAGGDGFAMFRGSLDYVLVDGKSTTTTLSPEASLRRYQSLDGVDQLDAELNLSHDIRWGAFRLRTLAGVETMSLGGEHLQDLATVGLEGRRGTRAGGFEWRTRVSAISAPAAFDYLDGWRARADARLWRQSGGSRLQVKYEAEFNDRDDLSRPGPSGPEFFSHSAIRNALGARWRLGSRSKSLEFRLRDRYSVYADPNVFDDGAGNLVEERRQENLVEAGVRLSWPLGQAVRAVLDYEFSDNTASLDNYEYRRHFVSLGVEWSD